MWGPPTQFKFIMVVSSSWGQSCLPVQSHLCSFGCLWEVWHSLVQIMGSYFIGSERSLVHLHYKKSWFSWRLCYRILSLCDCYEKIWLRLWLRRVLVCIYFPVWQFSILCRTLLSMCEKVSIIILSNFQSTMKILLCYFVLITAFKWNLILTNKIFYIIC